MAISYVEIYCEQAYDLLKDNTVGTEDPRHCAAHSCLHSRDLPELRSLVCREVRHGARDLLACLEEGSRRRKIGETRLNERSSRGHSILRLSLEMQSGDGVRVSTLDFVDLAGSEGIHVENAGRLPQAPEDATHVSIGAFSKVLLSLAARTRPTEDLYASSLLTRMLREALGEWEHADVARLHGLTAALDDAETRATLALGSQAMNVRSKVSVNFMPSSEAHRKTDGNVDAVDAAAKKQRLGARHATAVQQPPGVGGLKLSETELRRSQFQQWQDCQLGRNQRGSRQSHNDGALGNRCASRFRSRSRGLRYAQELPLEGDSEEEDYDDEEEDMLAPALLLTQLLRKFPSGRRAVTMPGLPRHAGRSSRDRHTAVLYGLLEEAYTMMSVGGGHGRRMHGRARQPLALPNRAHCQATSSDDEDGLGRRGAAARAKTPGSVNRRGADARSPGVHLAGAIPALPPPGAADNENGLQAIMDGDWRSQAPTPEAANSWQRKQGVPAAFGPAAGEHHKPSAAAPPKSDTAGAPPAAQDQTLPSSHLKGNPSLQPGMATALGQGEAGEAQASVARQIGSGDEKILEELKAVNRLRQELMQRLQKDRNEPPAVGAPGQRAPGGAPEAPAAPPPAKEAAAPTAGLAAEQRKPDIPPAQSVAPRAPATQVRVGAPAATAAGKRALDQRHWPLSSQPSDIRTNDPKAGFHAASKILQAPLDKAAHRFAPHTSAAEVDKDIDGPSPSTAGRMKGGVIDHLREAEREADEVLEQWEHRSSGNARLSTLNLAEKFGGNAQPAEARPAASSERDRLAQVTASRAAGQAEANPYEASSLRREEPRPTGSAAGPGPVHEPPSASFAQPSAKTQTKAASNGGGLSSKLASVPGRLRRYSGGAQEGGESCHQQ
eukprot:CAMPEP_0178454084 /NCGR_PEP_ID=MMETSP0689_2-20121128/45163_1 /TAXON_ID=160604 /ORGANISM="Amphidinium massartii, Strain CS-259" /LENGTH=892 /DNA_ID=CAMNT_0020079981 /DNA_START=13 /DNA_END=2689 /DNA_ORIENTATION=+